MRDIYKNSDGTIPRNNGAIGCCCCDGPTSGENVFEITKEEYLAYKKGGTWALIAEMDINEYGTLEHYGPVTNHGSGDVSGNIAAEGCSHDISITLDASGSWSDPLGPSNWPRSYKVSLQVNLGQADGKYYVQCIASIADIISSDPADEYGANYISTKSIAVDGNYLVVYSAYVSDLLSYGPQISDYSSGSSASITSTFTPTPDP